MEVISLNPEFGKDINEAISYGLMKLIRYDRKWQGVSSRNKEQILFDGRTIADIGNILRGTRVSGIIEGEILTLTYNPEDIIKPPREIEDENSDEEYIEETEEKEETVSFRVELQEPILRSVRGSPR